MKALASAKKLERGDIFADNVLDPLKKRSCTLLQGKDKKLSENALAASIRRAEEKKAAEEEEKGEK